MPSFRSSFSISKAHLLLETEGVPFGIDFWFLPPKGFAIPVAALGCLGGNLTPLDRCGAELGFVGPKLEVLVDCVPKGLLRKEDGFEAALGWLAERPVKFDLGAVEAEPNFGMGVGA